MRWRENILHLIALRLATARLSRCSGWLQTLLKWHNMWIIAMFYQGVKQVRRKLCTSCTSRLSWQNACINSDLVNTIKTSAPIKHFYEVTGRINGVVFFFLSPPYNGLWKVCRFFLQLLRGGPEKKPHKKTQKRASSNKTIIWCFQKKKKWKEWEAGSNNSPCVNYISHSFQVCGGNSWQSAARRREAERLSASSETPPLHIFHAMTVAECARWHRGSLFTLYLRC